MQSTLKRLAAVAALGTIGILAPTAGASATVTPTTPAKADVRQAGLGYLAGALVAGPWGGPVAWGLGVGTGGVPGFVGLGQTASVIGPTVITTAPSLFVNTNNQVSAGSNLSGGQGAL
jgi:4-amino-4-deoxy-L-arabinose transferase-like glycosyltransferase